MPLTEDSLVARVALRHSVSPEAVRTILWALRSGRGTMAQFSRPEFELSTIQFILIDKEYTPPPDDLKLAI